ncbi:PAS domain S-box-containing protein [Zunongwangia mangrovi]|uniref:PAS domain S-box-containing protein n=1 Tax=Zunongwangia mangrovi TaxID=1334022 RepID=A0A1I1HWE5_9FLAO|nr:response regulator [Zunongwangia mangrovi]SFC26298.1 PAS domain S-box-containing protein [Zunongwangia mangrovi]
MTHNKTYKILLISNPEEEPFCIKAYLDDSIIITRVTNIHSTSEAINELKEHTYHIIFLDLGKPGKAGLTKLDHILAFTTAIPVVILSNQLNMAFSIRCLERGASDYLIKDSLDTFTVYKAIRHNIDRRSYIHALEESRLRYSRLFHLSPQPMWVYDIETLQFIDVNEAAQTKYGHTLEEFLSMKITDIRSTAEIPKMLKTVYETRKNLNRSYKGIFKHRTKDKQNIDVEIHSNLIKFNNKPARLILANDITEQLKHIKAMEAQNKKLREIAWTQSHVVRAPLVRMMALVNMLNDNFEDKSEFYLEQINKSAQEFDQIIREISEKTARIEFDD